MAFDFHDKVFFLTGCASGIGKRMMEEVVKRGGRVFAADINLKGLKAASKSLGKNVVPVQLDVRSAAQWKKALQSAQRKWGSVDVCINIAGYLKPGFLHETPTDEIDKHMMINALGVMYGTQAAAQMMVKRGHGRIINIASLAGVAPIPGISLYSTSKFAVRGFSLAVAEELSTLGVSVTVVCPDAVRTPMLDLQKNYKEAALTFSAPRFLETDDVVNVILGSVLDNKPREVLIPPGRGILAKIGNSFPGMASMLAGSLRKKGLSRQDEMKGAK